MVKVGLPTTYDRPKAKIEIAGSCLVLCFSHYIQCRLKTETKVTATKNQLAQCCSEIFAQSITTNLEFCQCSCHNLPFLLDTNSNDTVVYIGNVDSP